MTDDTIATWMQRYPEPRRVRKAKPRKDLRAATGIMVGVALGAVAWLLIWLVL